MTEQTLIAVDPEKLDAIFKQLERVNRRLDGVQMQQKPEWLTVGEYADHVGRTKRTVNNWIDAGRVETKMDGEVKFVRVNRGA